MQVWLGCLRESGLHLPPSGPQFTQSRARGPPGLGLQGPEVAAQLGGSLPHRCSQPANLPPRDYIKQSPPPGCARGVARGRGWRGAGKDGCFPGLVIFPAAGWLARLRWGVDPDPRRSIAQSRSRTEVGSREARIQPSFISCFPFSPPCLFLSHFLSGRGRGPEREGKGEEGTSDIPVHQACWVWAPPRHQTTRLWVRNSREGAE